MDRHLLRTTKMFINKLLTNLLNVVAITHKWGKRIAKPCTVINIKYLPELGSLEVALYGATAIQNMQKKKIDESIIRFNNMQTTFGNFHSWDVNCYIYTAIRL